MVHRLPCQRNYRRFAYLKKAAAYITDLGVLPTEKRDAIAAVCEKSLLVNWTTSFH
jgi:fumarate hydratase class II